jgi:hypothetical protein
MTYGSGSWGSSEALNNHFGSVDPIGGAILCEFCPEG